jgi:DNA polymerase elongation subunit (family B)
MNLWYYNKGSHIVQRGYIPWFYVRATRKEDALTDYLQDHPSVVYYTHERKSLLSREDVPLIRVVLQDYNLREIASEIDRMGGYELYDLFNVDISLPQRYFFETDTFPMMNTEEDSPFAVEYEVPPLKELFFEVTTRTDGISLFSDPLSSMTVRDCGDAFELDGAEDGIIQDFLALITAADPDILYTVGGDEFAVPYLVHRGKLHGVSVELGREPGMFTREGTSYFSYGRILYKPSQHMLKGRIHIDTRSSFQFREGGLDGLIELARMSRIPVQRLSRLSSGTAISSMQLYEAFKRDIPIPWRKQTPERFKTALQLLKADRGGHILEPRVGIFDHVGEVDFSSLYPNIISTFNISPETVLCGCCSGSRSRVPILEYHICEKERGFIPDVITPIIVRKALYKGNPALKGRRALLKSILVTCFGYLGYRNARFGRIECHESVTAYAREILLTSMHMAEEQGFEVLHGIVDSLWLRKICGREEFEGLCEQVSEKIGIPLELEGIYSWIVFLPSTMGIGALNRYYGVIDGELKARGIELRRRDQPRIIKKMQEAMLYEMAQADTAQEVKKKIPDVLDVVRHSVDAVMQGTVGLEDLTITIGITRSLEDYRVNNLSVAALNLLKREGVDMYPGQKVQYIIRNWKARKLTERVSIPEMTRDAVYDREKYAELIIRAACTMLSPFGFNEHIMQEHISNRAQKTLRDYL